EIVLESTVAGAQQTHFVPTSGPSKRTQGGWIGRSDDRHVNVLGEVMSNPVPAIHPGRTHRARTGLFLPVHHLIDDQRTIWRREEFTQPHLSYRLIAFVQGGRTFKKFVITSRRAPGQASPQLRASFALFH